MFDYAVFDGLSIGVQVVDHAFRYVYLNRKLCSEVGMNLADVVGYSMSEKFPGIENTDIHAAIRQCLENGGTSKFINEFKFPDGRVTYWELELHRIDAGVLLFSRDITETRRGELLLRETNKNLEHFAHIAAHDLREPARRMRLLAEELLLDFGPALDAEGTRLCKALLSQSDKMLTLIGDFRSLSGIVGGGGGAREAASALELLRAALEAHAQRFAEAGVVVSLPAEDRTIDVHASMVGILLRNLFENALVHGHRELNVRLEGPPGATVFAVSNRTLHAPLEQDPFLPFVGRDRARRTGLGLAIAKRVAEYHGGRIWAEQDDQTFTVRFTLAPGSSPSGAHAPSPERPV